MIRRYMIKGLSTGEEIDLADFDKYLLLSPNNIGFSLTNSYILLGNQRSRTNQQIDFNNLTATIQVSGSNRDEWEANYNALRTFFAKNKDNGYQLWLATRTGDLKSVGKYIVCDIKEVNKTDKERYGILVGIVLQPKSLWQVNRRQEIDFSVTEDTDILGFLEHTDGYYYGWQAEYSYEIKYFNTIDGKETIQNSGDAEAPLLIQVNGVAVNPHISLINIAGEVIQSCQINLTLSANQYIEINSDPDNLYIKLVDTNAQTERLVLNSEVNNSYSTYLTVPVGEYTLRISDDENNNISGQVTYSLQYLGG